MELLRYEDIDLSQTVKRSEEDVNNVLDTVSDILKNVRQNKDQSLKDYTQKFDKVIIDNLKVTDEEINGILGWEICYKTNKICVHYCSGLCRESC